MLHTVLDLLHADFPIRHFGLKIGCYAERQQFQDLLIVVILRRLKGLLNCIGNLSQIKVRHFSVTLYHADHVPYSFHSHPH